MVCEISFLFHVGAFRRSFHFPLSIPLSHHPSNLWTYPGREDSLNVYGSYTHVVPYYPTPITRLSDTGTGHVTAQQFAST